MRATWVFIGSTFIIAAAAFGCGENGSSSSGGSGGQGTSSSSAGGNSNSSASGMGTPCKAASECMGNDNICAQRTCDNGFCGLKILINNGPNPSQVYGDCKMSMCDAKGTLSDANDDMDVYDDGNPCTVDSCSAGMPLTTPAMLGMMCGDMANPKVCDMASTCVQCNADMDCMANPNAPSCSQGKCVPATCVNMAKDGAETDVDCGGAACVPCKDASICKVQADCASMVCNGNPKACQAPSCSDGVTNGKETDGDCGGPDCVPMGFVCDDGGKCKLGTDCKSSVCKAGVCQAPTCTDGVQNGTEKGADCGDPPCAACP